jgi:hypothetical protein
MKSASFAATYQISISGTNTRNGVESSSLPQWPNVLPLSPPAKSFRFERQIKTLSQRILTTYRLPIGAQELVPGNENSVLSQSLCDHLGDIQDFQPALFFLSGLGGCLLKRGFTGRAS